MKKILWVIALAVTISLLFGAFGCAKPAPAPPAPTPAPAPPAPTPAPIKPIELSLSLFIPEPHLRYQHVWKPWIQMVEEKTNGKVKIIPYFAGALAPLPANYDAVGKGIADIGEVLMHATPGRFPLTEMVTLPALVPSSLSASKIDWALYNKFPEVKAEYPGVKVMAVYASPTCRFETVEKPVYKLEDIKGMKIRVTGPVAVEAAEALGFTPITMPMGDVYLALERGVFEGVAIPVEVLVSRKWAEVLSYAVGNADLGHDCFAMVFNENSWNKLPQDVRSVFNELSGSWMVEFCASEWDRFEVEAVETAKTEYGLEVNYLSEEELARWNELVIPVKYAYAESLDAKGLPGTKVLEETERLAKELE